jgi:hypothetical protein
LSESRVPQNLMTYHKLYHCTTSLVIVLICFPSKVTIFKYTEFLDVGPIAITKCF